MQDFKAFFEQDYLGSEAFIARIIQPIFGGLFTASSENILVTNPSYKTAAERANILAIHRFGSCDLDVPMQFFDITLNDHVNITHSRVYIQQLLRQMIETYSTALIVFHYEDNHGEWRVSYVSKGSNAADATSAKRYTYLMGANQKCRTAADRFTSLITKEKSAANITEAFSVETLTKEFYKELFAWYQLALSSNNGFEVTYPNDTSTEADDRKIDEHIIRLITRLMFVWFIKQKKLVPEKIFQINELQQILTNFDPLSKNSGNFYNAILQNLFFATLNKPINEREFASDAAFQGKDKHYGIKTLFRDAKEGSWFRLNNHEIIELFNGVPFLNGGLFECLDKENADGKIIYHDGFSRKSGRQSRAFLPNCLFFDNKTGIISLLEKYNFTVEENTPTDVEVALDPELLGKVFENLLGAYNPETKDTARKQSGSFYTPREIVNYMVDESLIAYLTNVCPDIHAETIRQLFTQDTLPDELKQTHVNCKKLADAIKAAKMLDPACGSGAFPMGMLNRMLDILYKLSPTEISNYDTKLYLIENCIYGIDIQTIAVQITKLRFFISLICEQTPTKDAETNYGIIALPNLETKFVAANTLIGLVKKPSQGNLFEDPTGEIEKTKSALNEIRHKHFSANNAHDKKEYRKQDAILREKLAGLLEANGDFAPEDAIQLAAWNPYDQNTSSKFFDAEWMFGIKGGFDLVVGNPPYVQLQKDGGCLADLYQNKNFVTFERTGDIYSLFYENGVNSLKCRGHLCFITSNKWMRAGYGKLTRLFFSKHQVIQLINLGSGVFDSATVDTNILLIQKIENNNIKYPVKALDLSKLSKIQDFDFYSQIWQSIDNLTDEIWTIFNPTQEQIKQKIQLFGKTLKDWNIDIYRGITTGYNDAFIIDNVTKERLCTEDSKSNEIIKPILRGKDINPYSYNWDGLWLIAAHNGFKDENNNRIPPINIDDFFAVKKHLENYLPQLIKRKDKGNTPFNLRNCAYQREFEKEKIILTKASKVQSYCIDSSGYYLQNTAYFISTKFAKYLVAVLNSRFCNYFFIEFYQSGGIEGEITIQSILNLPIPFISELQQEPFKVLVNEIIERKSTFKQIEDLERQIDELVFKLYNLTYEEVLVVCPDFWLSAEDYKKNEIK